ncbi:MAG: hypothetical protein SNJ57_15830 [Cyanobacteriota bacterium]
MTLHDQFDLNDIKIWGFGAVLLVGIVGTVGSGVDPQGAIATVQKTVEQTSEKALDGLESLFSGGSDSLVARTVGSAEGTRTPTGDRTSAYNGHTDPGNGVHNLGTFSYQHGASSPEEADKKQLERLRQQTETLQKKAKDLGLELTQAELLNGIDLANQAPQAALDRGGYVERLAEAKQQGKFGDEAILWARTQSFIDPDTQQWNAPGLGNNADSIERDQQRRMEAIAAAEEEFQR